MGLKTSRTFQEARRHGAGGLNKPLSASGIRYAKPKGKPILPNDKTRPAYNMARELFDSEIRRQPERVNQNGVVKRPCKHCGQYTKARMLAGSQVFDCGCRSTGITTEWVLATDNAGICF